MDHVTAIGLASSIIAFVDFGWKLVKGAKEIYDAADGTLEENRSREAVVLEMKRLTVQLVSPEHSLLSGEERDLCLLAGTCRKLSDKLLDWLERVKPKNEKSKMQSLWAALKNTYYESEREDLEKRLGACRSQLALHMNATTMFSIDKLSEYVKDNASSLKPLKKAMSQLSRIGADTQTQVRQLLNIQKNALHAIIKARILAGLKFEGMHDRHDMVAEAHEKTFRWIFNVEGDGNLDMQEYSAKTPYRQDDATKEEAELKEEARERFLQWLSSGSGIFHISGKMGSGKSTLVNFLSDHPETATRLETWANNKQLVLASFFFWRPGSDMQKSLSGLYRSLLHDVLSFCPELIPDVFPNVWQRAMETPYDGQTKEYFQESDIKNGFNVLVTKEELFEHHSFCFFIDGLDEYQAPADAVISDMVDELYRWTITSPSSVKLCVSSREYPEFMDKFSPSQRLRLHTLTRFDIEAYVRDKLGRTEDKGIATLTKSIVEKASGIFFWVSLVVRQIREQLEIGVEPARLVEIVNGCPVGLDHLYRHILQTLSPYSRKRAYQTLAMMPFVGGTNDSLPLDLLAYSFLDKYNEDPEFARKETFDAGLSHLRAYKETTRSQARSLLNGWCRGLVEADENGHLGYAHRSVADFLEAADIRERMAASVNGSHPVSIFSELILAHLKVGVHHGLSSCSFFQLVGIRHKYSLDQAPFSFLRCLDTLNANIWDILGDPFATSEIAVPTAKHCGNVLAQTNMRSEWRSMCLSLYFFPWLSTEEYVLWMISNDPKTTDSVLKAVLLFCAEQYSRKPTYKVLDLLLERGIITPLTQTHLTPFKGPGYHLIRDGIPMKTHSIWNNFLTHYFYKWLVMKTNRMSMSKLEKDFGSIAERFLKFGADPRFRAEILEEGNSYSNAKYSLVANFFFGDPSLPERHSYQRIRSTIFPAEVKSKYYAKMQTFSWEAKGEFWVVSFRGWIQTMDDLPNKAALLQLVDDRMRELVYLDTGHKVTDSNEQEMQSLDTNISTDRPETDACSLTAATEMSKAVLVRTTPAAFSYIFAVLLIISAILGYSRLTQEAPR